MSLPRYYATLNEASALPRPQTQRSTSSQSFSRIVAQELDMTLQPPNTTESPALETSMHPSPTYSTIIDTEIELSLRPASSFLVPALHQKPTPGSLLYRAPLHTDGEPVYPLLPHAKRVVLEAEADVFAAFEANYAPVEHTRSGLPRDNSDLWYRQFDTAPAISPISRPSGPTGFTRCTSKTFEGMHLEQDVAKSLRPNWSSNSSDIGLEDKLKSAHAKHSKRSHRNSRWAKCSKYLCGKD